MTTSLKALVALLATVCAYGLAQASAVLYLGEGLAGTGPSAVQSIARLLLHVVLWPAALFHMWGSRASAAFSSVIWGLIVFGLLHVAFRRRKQAA